MYFYVTLSAPRDEVEAQSSYLRFIGDEASEPPAGDLLAFLRAIGSPQNSHEDWVGGFDSTRSEATFGIPWPLLHYRMPAVIEAAHAHRVTLHDPSAVRLLPRDAQLVWPKFTEVGRDGVESLMGLARVFSADVRTDSPRAIVEGLPPFTATCRLAPRAGEPVLWGNAMANVVQVSVDTRMTLSLGWPPGDWLPDSQQPSLSIGHSLAYISAGSPAWQWLESPAASALVSAIHLVEGERLTVWSDGLELVAYPDDASILAERLDRVVELSLALPRESTSRSLPAPFDDLADLTGWAIGDDLARAKKIREATTPALVAVWSRIAPRFDAINAALDAYDPATGLPDRVEQYGSLARLGEAATEIGIEVDRRRKLRP